MSSDMWPFVELLDAHLDAGVAETYKDQPLAQDWARVAKLVEEAGEAIQALIACTGQNPRKGVCGNVDDLLDELADAALTGIYAIQHFTKNVRVTQTIIEQKAIYHCQRVGITFERAEP